MIVGTLELSVRLHGCHSLKEKRSSRQKICARVRNAFGVAVAEVDHQDTHNLLVIGVATVGSDARVVERVLRDVADFVDRLGEGELIDEVVEVDHR